MFKTVRNLLATAPILKKAHVHQSSEIKLMQQDKYNIEDEASGLLNHTKIHTIYLDMDGVLVDHYGYLAESLNITKQAFIDQLTSFKTKEEKENYIIPLILNSIDDESFIKSKPTKEFNQFLRLIEHWLNLGIDVQILSSTMQEHGRNNEIKRQKQIWLSQNGLDHIRANFVKGSKYKQDYADQNCLLIDDYKRTIDQWSAWEGAVGIHHTDMITTLKQLKQLGLL